jgi:TP901 family phage tail tape measure protein
MTNQVDEAFVTIRPDLSKFASELNTQIDKALSDAEKKTRGFNMLSSQLSGVGQALTLGVTAPLAAIGGLSLKAAIDFESAFAGVRKTVDATDAEFDQLEKGIRDMAKSMPESAAGIASIVEQAGQLGIANDSLLDFSRTVVMLDETTDLTADNVADAFARIANITQLPQDEFDELGSTVVDLGNKLAATESEIVDFGLRIAGAGKIAGLNQAEILGIGAAMASVGVEAEAGGTAVQKVLLSMTDAVASGNSDLQIFAATAGMTASEFATAFKEDAAGAFTAFVEGLGSSGDDAFKVLQALGLEDQRLIRSFLSLAGAGDLLQTAISIGNTAFAENTALQTEYSKRLETSAAKLELFWNRLTDVAITLGAALVPALTAVIDIATPFIDVLSFAAEQFAAAPPALQVYILALVGLAAVIGPLIVISASLITAFSTVSVAAATAGISFTAMLGPIGLIIIAIGALIAAFVLLDVDFKKLASGLVQAAKNQFKLVVNEFKSMVSIFTNTAKLLSAVVHGDWSRAFEAAKDIAVAVIRQITLLPRLALNALYEGGKAMGASLGDGVKGALVPVLNWVIDQINWLIRQVNGIKLPFGLGRVGLGSVGLGVGEIDHITTATKDLGNASVDTDKAVKSLSESTKNAGAQADLTGLDLDNLGSSAGGTADKVNILEDGIISLAEALDNGLTAAQAGAIEGVDLLAKQEQEAAEKAFDLSKELSKLATVFQSNTKAAQQYVLALAREALEKTKAAISAVFGGPTKETAALELQLAQLSKGALELGHALNPQIEALEAQIERIRDAASDQRDAIEDQIDVIRDEAAARKKALQQQIDDYKDNAAEQKKALQRQLESLRDKVPHNDIEEAQNKHQADALEARIRNLDDATDAEVKRLEDRRDAQDDETDRQLKALEKQRDAVEANAKAEEERTQKQIDALQSQLDAYDRQTDAIQYQIDLYGANARILQAQITAADQTLLTEDERQRKGEELIGLVASESEAVRNLTGAIGEDLIPEMDAAREAHAHLKETIQVLNDEAFRNSLLPTIMGPDGVVVAFDAAAARAALLATKADAAAGAVAGLGGAAEDAAHDLREGISNLAAHAAATIPAYNNTQQGLIPPEFGGGKTSGPAPGSPLSNLLNGQLPPATVSISERDLGINGYANGLDYVPFDNFLARLHKGEKVLTAAEAANYRGGDTGDIIVNIDTVNATDVASARRAVGDLVMGVSAGLRLRGGRPS